MTQKTKAKPLLYPAVTVLLINLILFFVKLFVGLSANSISVYSDAVNNLFDCLSGALASGATVFAASSYFAEKTEQLVSFVMSCFIGFSGVYFLYSSFERLMYPTPVWYTQKYFVLLCVTAAVKLLLYLVLKKISAKNLSPVIQLMSADSLLDFFIGLITLLTLLLSKGGNYAFDALCGIAVSVIIVVTAVRSASGSVKLLINYVTKDKRQKIERMISADSRISSICSIEFSNADRCFITADFDGEFSAGLQELCDSIKEQTGINIILIKKGK